MIISVLSRGEFVPDALAPCLSRADVFLRGTKDKVGMITRFRAEGVTKWRAYARMPHSLDVVQISSTICKGVQAVDEISCIAECMAELTHYFGVHGVPRPVVA